MNAGTCKAIPRLGSIHVCMAAMGWALTLVGAVKAQLVVDKSGAGTHTSIQAAIVDAASGMTITVNPGTYIEHIDFLGKSLHVTGTDPTHDGVIAATIIDGAAVGHVVTFQSGESAGAILEGVTVTNGNAEYGAGIYCINGSSPIIRNNQIDNNFAVLHGCGIYVIGGSPQIISNDISDNLSEGRGVGIYVEAGAPLIQGNLITGNYTAMSSGGGINLAAGTDGASVIENTIEGNTAIFGGALHVEKSSPIISRNWMVGNIGLQRAGGISCIDSSAAFSSNVIAGNWSVYAAAVDVNSAHPTLLGNTIVGNLADLDAVILGINGSSITLTGNIISHNTQGTAVHVTDDSTATLAYNCLFGNVGGNTLGPVTVDPTNLFVDPLIVALGSWVGGGGGGDFGPRGNNEFRLIAAIAGQEDRTGEGDYRLEPGRERFDMTLVGFPPNTTQPVFIKGIFIGNVQINPLGLGVMDLDSDNGNFPPSFPTVFEGDEVNINSLAAGFLLDKDGVGMLWQAGDEHLNTTSPCIDAWTDYGPDPSDLDIDGQPRLVGPAVDLGADEVN